MNIVLKMILQNEKELKPYYQALTEKQCAITKGITLSADDEIRATVIKQLICHFELDKGEIEQQFAIDFEHYFADSLAALAPLCADGLVEVTKQSIKVTSSGNLFIRIICMCFDAYLQKQVKNTRFSRVI